MNNKKGFTLIELLAVILILGVIAVIAIPTVNSIINTSKLNVFKNTNMSIIDVIESNCKIDIINGIIPEKEYKFDGTEVIPHLDAKGDFPEAGYAKVNNDCKVEVRTVGGFYCAIKNYNDDTVYVYDDLSKCELKEE